MPQKSVGVCSCNDCKAQKRKGRILWGRLLKHLGSKAHHVSCYRAWPKWAKGKRIRRPNNKPVYIAD